jgi:hypothetical protein
MDVQPTPGEACTELGADQDERPGMEMLAWLMVTLAVLVAAGLAVAA